MSRACDGETVTLRRLLPALAPRDHALVALFAALCALPPIPMPGLSIVFALTAVTAGSRMALGLEPWLPSRLLDRPMPARPPAGAMLLVCLGVLESDGLVLLAGYFATALSAAFFIAIACLGMTGLRALLRV